MVEARVLLGSVAERVVRHAHCTVLVYECASDGAVVRRVESRLTGKQHLTKSGLLSVLEKAD